MSRKATQVRTRTASDNIAVSAPAPMSRDELGTLGLSSLDELRSRYKLEREIAVSTPGTDPRPWEEEIAYIELAMERRRQYETVTPRHLWS